MSSKNPPTSNNDARRFTNDNNGEGSFRGGFDFGFIFGLRKNNNSNDVIRKEKSLLSPDQKISKVKDAKVNNTNRMSNPTTRSGVVQNIQKKKEEKKKPIKKKEPEFLTLSVHEDTTFNGVGIVFHPKFSQKKKKSEKNQQQVTHNNDNGINYHNQINSFSNPYNNNHPLHFQRQQHHNVPSGNFQQRSQFQCRFQNHYNININTTNNFNTIQNNSYINNYNSNISVGMETKSEEEEEEEEDCDDDLLKPGDLVQIYVWDVNDGSNINSNAESPPQTRVERKRNNYKLRTSFVIRTTEESLDNIKENARTQISIRRKVADLYNLSSFDVLSFSRVQFENDAATTNADTDDDEDDEEEDIINDNVSTDSNKIKKKVPLSTFDSTSTKRDEEELRFLKSTKSYADFITLTFKDRFISRGEMFQLQNSLVGQWMFEGERIVTENLQANAYKIRDENSAIKSGIVTKESKITFRSRSARIIWLVQIATEMWEYTNPSSGICGIYFDKYVQFIKKLFNKWKELDVSHSLTVVFFSRTFVYNNSSNNPTSSTLKMDIDGRYYEDNYKVVIENETRADWDSLVYIIKKEFLLYPKQVGWNIMNGAGIGTSVPTSTESSFDPVSSQQQQQQNTTNCIRLPSIASQGNILEAINVALNMLQLHYMDRDLYRTGNSLVVVTPGCGVFEVNKDLASITKQRMMDNGIGSDMVSLSLPPLHIAPFFLYKENRSVVKDDDDDDWKAYFEIPHWMHLSFVSYDNKDRKSVSKTSAKDQITSTSTKISSSEHSVINKSKAQQRHLISGREFDDILEACRPRNRIDISTPVVSSLPSALLSIVSSSSSSGAYNSNSTKQPSNTSSPMNSSIITPATTLTSSGRLLLNPPALWKKQTHNQPHHPDILSPSNQQQQSQSMNITEWGRINLDDMRTINNTPNNVGATNTVSSANIMQTSNNQMAQFAPSSPGNSNTNTNGPNSMKRHSFQESGSDASPSPSSSFNSTYSYLLSRSAATASGYSPSSTSHKFVPFSSHHTSTEIQPIQSYEDHSYRNFMLAGSEAGDAMTSSTHHTAATPTNSNANKFPKSDNSIDSILSTHSIHGDEPSHCTDDLKSFMMKYDSNVWKAHEKKKPEKKKPITIPDQQQSEYSKNASSLDRSTHSLIGRGPNQANMKPTLSHNALERGSVHGNRSGRIELLSNLMENNNLGNSNNNIKATPKLTNYNKVQKQGGIGAALGQFNKTVATNNTKKKSHRSGKKSNKKNNTTSNTNKNNKLSPPLRSQTSASNNMSPSFLGPPAIMAVASPPNLRQVVQTDNSKNINTNDKLSQHPMNFNINGNNNSYGNGYGNYQIIGSNHSLEINRHHYQVQAQNKKLNASYHGFTKKSTASYHQSKNAKGNKERKNSKKNIGLLSKQLHFPSRSSLKYAQPSNNSQQSRRKRRVLNPFREQDEEDVLAKRTHNRRRWSHVFPKGEVEFKRHAGPNWTSLCQPAILPLTIDYVPTAKELRDNNLFYSNPYDIRLDAMERSSYRTYYEAMNELITQRIIQDFQIIPQDIVRKLSSAATTSAPSTSSGPSKSGALLLDADNSHTLSMGHNIHSLSYNKNSDAIEVIQYTAKVKIITQVYEYMVWAPMEQKYLPIAQTFEKYSKNINWNKLDNLICGDPEKKLSEDNRYRRVIFAIIPDHFNEGDALKEHEYIKKIQRLLEYLAKQLKKDVSELGIKFITRLNNAANVSATPNSGRRRKYHHSDDFRGFKKFKAQLMKGKRNSMYQWMDILFPEIFDTRKTYRIVFSWLVASAAKVEAQIQLLKRRSAEYGINIVCVPAHSMSSTMFLHPLVSLPTLTVRNQQSSTIIEKSLVGKFSFIYDIEFYLSGVQYLSGMIEDFDFTSPSSSPSYTTSYNNKNMRKENSVITTTASNAKPMTTQYIHSSGHLFVRVIHDKKGWIALLFFENRKITSTSKAQQESARQIYQDVKAFIDSSCLGEFSLLP